MTIHSEEIFLEAGSTKGEATAFFENLAREQGITISIISVEYGGDSGGEDLFDITYEADEPVDY